VVFLDLARPLVRSFHLRLLEKLKKLALPMGPFHPVMVPFTP